MSHPPVPTVTWPSMTSRRVDPDGQAQGVTHAGRERDLAPATSARPTARRASPLTTIAVIERRAASVPITPNRAWWVTPAGAGTPPSGSRSSGLVVEAVDGGEAGEQRRPRARSSSSSAPALPSVRARASSRRQTSPVALVQDGQRHRSERRPGRHQICQLRPRCRRGEAAGLAGGTVTDEHLGRPERPGGLEDAREPGRLAERPVRVTGRQPASGTSPQRDEPLAGRRERQRERRRGSVRIEQVEAPGRVGVRPRLRGARADGDVIRPPANGRAGRRGRARPAVGWLPAPGSGPPRRRSAGWPGARSARRPHPTWPPAPRCRRRRRGSRSGRPPRGKRGLVGEGGDERGGFERSIPRAPQPDLVSDPCRRGGDAGWREPGEKIGEHRGRARS